MSTYECGSNTRKWWIYQSTRGRWVASAPCSADGPNLGDQIFPTHRAAVDHFVVTQRSLAATRFADLLRGSAE